MLLTVVLEEEIVAVDILEQLIEPFLSLVVCGDGGNHAKRIHVAHLVDVYRLVDALSPLVVLHDDVGNLQSGDVERLAWRYAGHAVLLELFRHGGKRCVGESWVYQFAVDFVGHHDNIVLDADVAYAPQLLPCPHSSRGVVRIAEQHKGGLRVGGTTLQVFIIDGESVVLIPQCTAVQFASVIPDRGEETVVYRSKGQHFITHIGQCLYYGRQCRNYSRRINKPFAPRLPMVASAEP